MAFGSARSTRRARGVTALVVPHGAVRIRRIPILPMGMVNAHLVVSRAGAILVDAGLPDTEASVHRALQREGLGWGDLRLIVVTHAHIDHAGNAARLRQLSRAPVCAHRGDLDHYLQRRPMSFCPTGLFGRLFLRSGLIQRPYDALEPDILLHAEEVLDLARFGIDGQVRPTPGHTAGSLSVCLDDGHALVGDLVASGILLGGIAWTSRAKSPPFEDEPALVARTLGRLADEGARRFYLGHGGPITADEVLRHTQRLLRQHGG
ncbi:MBL fold metallo-hydrolase [Ideonella sp. DXS29W]|uniref:MBL fold metallo-hydrolase n=1 Tax=Ideonella lacteola TaxID=2984193 RepID=A0ABU9BUX5_9BURK